MSLQAWAELVILFVCVFVAALASGTETALTSVSRLRVRHLAQDGSPEAAILQRLHSDPSRFLSTVLVINTFALIIASAATTLLTQQFLPPRFGVLGDFAVSFVLSIFLLIFAEVTPKTLAVRNADRVALQVAQPVEALSHVLWPLLQLVTVISRAVVGKGPARPFLTEAELLTLFSVSEEQGVIEEEEREMMKGIIEIGDMLVREVMVPRTDVIAIPRDADLAAVTALITQAGHTRLPVYDGSIDHVVGMVHAKDVMRVLSGARADTSIEGLMRPIMQVPEQKRVDELLHRMKREKSHMMVVVDEYGGTAGVVTLEDVLEEIVGEIRDEYDAAEKEMLIVVGLNEATVDARFPVDELSQRLGLTVEASDEFDTVAGYVNSQLGEIPQAGTRFTADGAEWIVEAARGPRVTQVRVVAERQFPIEVLVEAGLRAENWEGVPGAGPEG